MIYIKREIITDWWNDVDCPLPWRCVLYETWLTDFTLACNTTFLTFTWHILVSHFYFLFIIVGNASSGILVSTSTLFLRGILNQNWFIHSCIWSQSQSCCFVFFWLTALTCSIYLSINFNTRSQSPPLSPHISMKEIYVVPKLRDCTVTIQTWKS